MKICRVCLLLKSQDNFTGIRNQCKACAKVYRDSRKDLKKQYSIDNYEYIRKKKDEYSKKDPERWKKYRREYVAKRLKEDCLYKLQFALRSRMRIAIKRGYKSGSAVRDLGCSIVEFKSYLESKFKPGMTWENHGKWQIDHIIPLSSFDLTDRTQLLKACNYTNLQPLWASDNRRKSDKFDTISADGDLR